MATPPEREAAAAGESKPSGQGGVAGAGKKDEKTEDKKLPRSKQGRTAVLGGDRVVRLLKVTEQEINSFAKDEHRGTRQFAIAAFCLGLFIDTVFALILSRASPMIQGLGLAIAVSSAALALFFWIEGTMARKEAKNTLQEIVDQHDFD